MYNDCFDKQYNVAKKSIGDMFLCNIFVEGYTSQESAQVIINFELVKLTRSNQRMASPSYLQLEMLLLLHRLITTVKCSLQTCKLYPCKFSAFS